MDEKELVEGKWYEILLYDDHIEGRLYGIFLYQKLNPDGHTDYYFSCGRINSLYGSYWAVREL